MAHTLPVQEVPAHGRHVHIFDYSRLSEFRLQEGVEQGGKSFRDQGYRLRAYSLVPFLSIACDVD
jgi:hypothetical protein